MIPTSGPTSNASHHPPATHPSTGSIGSPHVGTAGCAVAVELSPRRRCWRCPQPVPPGQLTIGCDIGGTPRRRTVDLVDPSGYYREPELGCDAAERTTLTSLPVAPPSDNIITAARTGLTPHLVDRDGGDAIGPVGGYPSGRLGDATADPV